MAVKILIVLVLAIVGSHSQAVKEQWLDDETTTHISSPLHPKSIGIGKIPFDTLISCHIIFPNGMLYELYPKKDTFPHNSVSSNSEGSVDPNNPGCGVFFKNAPASLSGTYELMSLVEHTYTDSSRTLYRQKFHITFVPSELWPTN